MPNLIRYNKKNPCPVCGTGTKGCSHDSNAVGFTQGLYFCRGEVISSDYSFIKQASLWAVYAHVSDVQRNKELNRKEYLEQQKAARAAKELAERKEREKFETLTDVSTRNELLTALLNQLSLKPQHKAELNRRGLNDNQIKVIGFKSINNYQFVGGLYDRLPGFDNGYYVGSSGIICPIRNVNRQLIGFQIKTDNAEGGKYKWTRHKDTTAHLQNGELPLSVTIKSRKIGMCEGTLKPLIAASLHGISMIGASGGVFPQQQLKATLNALNPLNQAEIVIYPDSGYLANDQVFQTLIKTINQVLDLRYQVTIADWQHGLDKSGQDIDELETLEGIRYLTKTQLEESYKNPAKYLETKESNQFFAWLSPTRLVKELAKKFSVRTREIEYFVSDDEIQEYSQGNLPSPSDNKTTVEFEGTATAIYEEAIKKGYSHVLDLSATGSGKTYSASNVELSRAGINKGKLFYLSTQSRNPQIEKLEALFTELPARNKGYDYYNNKTTALGKPYRVATTKTTPDIAGNCHLVDKFFTARQKNTELDICGGCKFAKQCRTNKGDGFGFKYQLVNALTSDRLRGNPQGISDTMVSDTSVLIVDEYSQSVQWSNIVEVTVEDVQATLSSLAINLDLEGSADLLQFTSKVYQFLLQVDNDRFGIDTKKILPQLGQIDYPTINKALNNLEALINEYNSEVIRDGKIGKKEVLEIILQKDWLRMLVDIVAGRTPKSSLRKVRGKLTISVINDRWLNVVEKVKTVIWQDATGNREDLALRLGCKPEEILVVQQKQINHNNLEIIQLQGLGKATKDRSPELVNRINLARETLLELHSDIGFIDFKNHAKKGELNHFADAVGSNAYSNKSATCAIGIPYPNLSSVQLAYETYSGTQLDSLDDLEFKLFYDAQVAAQVIQEIGRLRANRRPEEYLTHYILGDLDTSFLTKLGYSVSNDHVMNLNIDCADKQSRARHTLKAAFESLIEQGEQLAQITQKQLAEVTKTTQQNIAKLAKSLGGWEQLKNIIGALIYKSYTAFKDECGELTEEIKYLAKSYLPLVFDLSIEEVAQELVTLSEAYTEEGLLQALSNLDTDSSTRLLTLILNQLPWSYQQEYLALKGLLN